MIDLDIQKFFNSVPWELIVKAVKANTGQPWVILYVQRWLAAPVQMPDGSLAGRDRGTPQGSAVTPPTQWITPAMVTLRIGFGGALAAAGLVAGRDAVPDGDLLGADEDVLDQQPQHPLAFFDGGGGGAAAQLGEEAFEVVGELEVGVAVGGLGVEGVELAAQVRLAGAQVRHPGAQLVDGDQLLGEASIMAVIEAAALASAASRRLRWLVAGSGCGRGRAAC